jgi:type IV secretory pathway VirB4 component
MGAPTGVTAAPNAPVKTQSTNTAQKSLLISEIRDGLVVMKDGSFRAVVAAQSINFDLMSPNEQDGVEYAYQSFLNSLTFDIQISIRSQKIDIGPYLEKLAGIRRNQDNMLLNVLMDDYMIFIDALAREANIMDKSFFICFSYGALDTSKQLATATKKGLSALTSPAPQAVKIGRPEFEAAKTEMARRSAAIIDGLRAVGVPAVRLDTRALAMLYYNFNNPDTAVNQPLVDWRAYTHLYTTKGAKKPEGEQNG